MYTNNTNYYLNKDLKNTFTTSNSINYLHNFKKNSTFFFVFLTFYYFIIIFNIVNYCMLKPIDVKYNHYILNYNTI